MKLSVNPPTVPIFVGLVTALIASTADAQPVRIAGVPCMSPPPLHCPDANCSNEPGHSHGGVTAHRLLMTPFFCDKVTGWVSLSGGRLGSPGAYVPLDSTSRYLVPYGDRLRAGVRLPGPPCSNALGVGLGDTCSLPDTTCRTFIRPASTSSQPRDCLTMRLGHRNSDAGRRHVDLMSSTRRPVRYGIHVPSQTRGPSAGRKPRSGRARVFAYPDYSNGHVADVIRMDKGHTAGLDPYVTEEIIKLMQPARDFSLAARAASTPRASAPRPHRETARPRSRVRRIPCHARRPRLAAKSRCRKARRLE